MDTIVWKTRIRSVVSSIEKQIEDLKDELSQLEEHKARFEETHTAIVAAEEKASELTVLFELDGSLQVDGRESEAVGEVEEIAPQEPDDSERPKKRLAVFDAAGAEAEDLDVEAELAKLA